MTFALVRNDTIQGVGPLPRAARTLTDGRWVKVREGTLEEQQECGYFAVADTPRPDDTDTTTHDRSVALVDGTPTVVWTARPKTADELAAQTEADNRTAIERNLVDDLAAVQAILDSTNATINQNPAAAIKAISRMLRRLGRFAVNDLSGTS